MTRQVAVDQSGITFRLGTGAGVFIGGSARDLADLVASTEDFDFSVLSPEDLRMLYESGEWHLDPGVPRLRQQIRDGEVDYVACWSRWCGVDYGFDRLGIHLPFDFYGLLRVSFFAAVEGKRIDLRRLPSEVIAEVPALKRKVLEDSLVRKVLDVQINYSSFIKSIRCRSTKTSLPELPETRIAWFEDDRVQHEGDPDRNVEDLADLWRAYRALKLLWDLFPDAGGPPFQVGVFSFKDGRASRLREGEASDGGALVLMAGHAVDSPEVADQLADQWRSPMFGLT